MRVASWNILSDLDAARHPSQFDRIDDIGRTIGEIHRDSARFLIYLCECVSRANIEEIAHVSGLVAIGEAVKYNDVEEYGIFLADNITAQTAIPEVINVDEGYSINWLNINGLRILGCHMPWQIIRKMPERRRNTDRILEIRPDLLVGDLNSPPFFLMRKRIERAGYTEAHAHDRPVFPHSSFRGVNVPLWFPGINIDAIYFRDTVTLSNTGYTPSVGSDHPIVWVDIES